MSISKPAKNINSNLPMSEKNCATTGSFGAIWNPEGPSKTPAASKPTAAGKPIRTHSFGTNKKTDSASANRVSIGRCVTDWTNVSNIVPPHLAAHVADDECSAGVEIVRDIDKTRDRSDQKWR